jgi:hypothetical protein
MFQSNYKYTKPSLIRSNWGKRSSGLVKRKVALKDKETENTNNWKI